MVGTSSAMQQLVQEVRRVAQGAAPVLVIGETGTGKELVARAIHACSPRQTAPFVAVNCAALPRELIESELFGSAQRSAERECHTAGSAGPTRSVPFGHTLLCLLEPTAIAQLIPRARPSAASFRHGT